MKQQLSFLDMGQGLHVRRIEYEDTIPFLMEIHYARRMPCITDAFGLFEGIEMIGVVTYGIPPSKFLCEGIAGKENFHKVKELNRLVILSQNGSVESERKNYASFLISHSLKMLENGTFVVSYADTAWTHIGYVYQASNFLYTGLSAARTDAFQPDGLHPRTSEKGIKNIRQTRSRKHRYVYLVGDKRTKKRMLSQLRYKVYKKYPKGNEIRYDPNDPKPTIPMQVWTKQ